MTTSLRKAVNFGWLILTLLILWEAVYLYAGDEALKPPIETFAYTAKLVGTELFVDNFIATMIAFGLAFFYATAIGLVLGFWLGFHRPSGEMFTPFLTAFASVPKVVLYPIILLICGLNMSGKVVFGAMHGIPPIALSTLGAVSTVRPVLLKLGRVLGLNSAGMLRVIVVPAALPELMTGLRIGFSLTLIGTILGEMFASQQGLGYLLMTAIGLHDVELIMSVTLILGVMAIAASLVLLGIDRSLRRRF